MVRVSHMDAPELLDRLRDEGHRLAAAAEWAGLDAPVPTCPDWRVRDLLGHIGGVHRWAAAHVAGPRPEPMPDDEVAPLFVAPADDKLVAWYRDGHADLVATLAAADPATQCWAFLPAPSGVAFWTRRQAHETTVHRIDAELAAGGSLTTIDAPFAADGVDELLACFITRRGGRLRADPPRSLRVRCTGSSLPLRCADDDGSPVRLRGPHCRPRRSRSEPA